MATPYERQKISALAGVPNYDYFVGTGYDAIPTTEFYNGFEHAFSDHSHRSVYEGVNVERNLPTNAHHLYKPYDTSDGLPGFHVFSEEHQAKDLAPVLVQRKTSQTDSLSSSFRGLHNLPQGQRTHSGIRFTEVPMQQDKGWPIGVLFGAPTSHAARRQGTVNDIAPFSK